MTQHKVGRVRLSDQVLFDLLEFRGYNVIRDATVDTSGGFSAGIELLIEGDMMPEVAEGDEVPLCHIITSSRSATVERVDNEGP